MKFYKKVVARLKKARRKDPNLVKCKSCGKEAHKVKDLCHGCQRVICLRCMVRFDHCGGWGAEHRLKND